MVDILALDSREALLAAQQVIRSGGVIAFPTDTVYGIGADVFQTTAIDKLYQIKKRDPGKGIPVLAADIKGIRQVVSCIPGLAERLAESFWPGPLTMILPIAQHLPENLAPDDTVGVRIPDYPGTLKLLTLIGPLAATSANLSGLPSATTADQVKEQIGFGLDLILDDGPSPGGTASTVVKFQENTPQILREGPISRLMIDEVLK